MRGRGPRRERPPAPQAGAACLSSQHRTIAARRQPLSPWRLTHTRRRACKGAPSREPEGAAQRGRSYVGSRRLPPLAPNSSQSCHTGVRKGQTLVFEAGPKGTAVRRSPARRAASFVVALLPRSLRYRKPVTEPPYRPLDAQVIPRFAGIRTFMRAPHVTELRGVDVAVYGIPFDTATTYRTGSRFGPEAIRSASALLRPYHPVHDVNVVEKLSIIDYGDLPVSPGDTERTYRQIEEALAPIVDAGIFPAAMGGDHSITLAELRVLATKHGPLALVQLDAHADTWDEYFGQKYFHGTTFKRAAEEGVLQPKASVQAGMRGSVYAAGDLEGARELGFTVITAEELRTLTPEQYGDRVRERVGNTPVFMSFDVDFLDPAFAPGTGTPEIAGFSTAEAVAFLRALRRINLVACDVVEVSPSYDGPGQQTALAAANVMFELLALHALSR